MSAEELLAGILVALALVVYLVSPPILAWLLARELWPALERLSPLSLLALGLIAAIAIGWLAGLAILILVLAEVARG